VSLAILLYEGVSGHEALAALAAAHAARTVSAELVAEDALVPTQEGARLVPTRLGPDALEHAAAVVLPSGDVTKALKSAPLARALRARRGKWLLAAGEGIRLAAVAGLAEGRRVALLPGERALAGTQPQHARLVADGRVLTSFPGDAIADLVLAYVAREHGDEVARKAAHAIGREYAPFAMGG